MTDRARDANGRNDTHVARLTALYRTMARIRAFEEATDAAVREGLVKGAAHLSIGQEAIAAGVCINLRREDLITSTHRGHGHTIAKGGDPKKMMAELLGRATGYSGGKGGSMHIADMQRGMLGANGIVGAGIGLATGAALTARLQGSGGVGVSFFGDGALNQGLLHECSNLAAIWKLPVVFVCENNQFAMSARVQVMTAVPDPADRAIAYGIPGQNVDGMDVLAVFRAASEAIERARAGQGPSFIVATTYRFLGHHVGDPLNYRTRDEVDPWQEKDAIERLRKHMIENHIATEEETQAIEAEVQGQVDVASTSGKEAAEPDPSNLMTDIYA